MAGYGTPGDYGAGQGALGTYFWNDTESGADSA
jgi:hypothetical protein